MGRGTKLLEEEGVGTYIRASFFPFNISMGAPVREGQNHNNNIPPSLIFLRSLHLLLVACFSPIPGHSFVNTTTFVAF